MPITSGKASHPCKKCGAPTVQKTVRMVEGRIVRWRECTAINCNYHLITEETEIGEDVGQLDVARWDYANERQRRRRERSR